MKLNVVSFDVPYPPDYGGVIDVFYKLKALYDEGVEIDLHCFQYGRNESNQLEKICSNVYYYRRYRNPFLYLHQKPFVVNSRANKSLGRSLAKNNAPILFEGLHSCYYLSDLRLKDRFKIVRMHNIEHHYYQQLSEAEPNRLMKHYLATESKKLKRFESILTDSNFIAAISENDTEYLHSKYDSVFHLPIFHGNTTVNIKPGHGKYALYHGNLSVSENEKAALFLIENIFNDLDVKFYIAGHNPSNTIINSAQKYTNIVVMKNLAPAELYDLVHNAQINVLPTFQATGIKLKVINALFNGRHCLVNKEMITDSKLSSCCEVADTVEEMKSSILRCMKKEISQQSLESRQQLLQNQYSNSKNIKILLNTVFASKI